jgi:hypothetical protein
MANNRIDFSKYLSNTRAESECVSRHMNPQRETRPQSEKEQSPDYFQRQQKLKEPDRAYRQERGY